MVRLGTCGHTLSLPASQLLSTAVFAALTPTTAPHPLFLPLPLSSSSTPPYCPYAPLLRRSHIHSAFLFRRHRRRHLGSGFVALARTQLPRTTHLTLPPHPPYHRGLGVPMDSVCVVACHRNMTQRLQCWTSRFAKTVECWVCSTWLWKGS